MKFRKNPHDASLPSTPPLRLAASLWPRFSTALNLLLLAALTWSLARPAAPASTPAGPAVPATAQSSASFATTLPPIDFAEGAPPPPSAWVDQLRRLGIPETTLAEIVSQYLSALQHEEAAKHHSLGSAPAPGEETLAALDLRQRIEKRAAMRSALGDEAFRRWDRARTLQEARLDKLPVSPAEADQLYKLLSDLDDTRTRLQLAHENGELDPVEANERDTELIEKYDARLAALLGPERLSLHQNPPETSPEAGLREQLGAYTPPPEKFAALLEADAAWQTRFVEERDNLSEESLDALLRSRDIEYKRALGQEEYERFLRANDPAVGVMMKYAKAWKLSADDVERTYQLLRAHRARLASTPEADQAAVHESSRQSLLRQLGQERFARLDRADVFSLPERP